MIKKRWEHFQHQADVGVRGIGASKEEAFQQVALAMTAIVAELGSIVARDVFEVECEAEDDELLLVDWLNTLIFEMATRQMLFSRFDVWVGSPKLRARVWGEPVDVEKHRPAVEVKAATFHEAKVFQNEEGAWVAQCVVDV